jgi:Zn-dependent protease
MQLLEPVLLIAVLIFSVIIHEVSHGYVASLLGDPTARLEGRLSLNPLKHLDWYGSVVVPGLLIFFGGFIFGWAKPVPYNPHQLRGGKWGPAWVALAGPASNILIALVFSLTLRFAAINALLSAPTLQFLVSIIALNLTLAVFNMVPVPPLDGSKVLFAALPYRYRSVEAWFTRNQLLVMIILLVIVLNTSVVPSLVGALLRLLIGI